MDEPILRYDEASDTLHVSFEPGQAATGVELNENILLPSTGRGESRWG